MGCGMAPNLNDKWERKQLFPHLQINLAKCAENFNGTSVVHSHKIDERETESEEEEDK